MEDYDYRTDFPEGLPWLKPVEAPARVAGEGGAALAAHLGLPSGTAWKWHLDWSPNPADVLKVSASTIVADGGFVGVAELEGADANASSDLREFGGERIPGVVAEILAGLEDLSSDLADELSAAFLDVSKMPGACLVAAGPHGADKAAAIAFARQLHVDGQTVNLVVTPLLILTSGHELSAAALNAAFHNQMQCDLECIANGIWASGIEANVACFLNVPPGSLQDGLQDHLANLVDMAQDILFGVGGWYAPEHADWDTLVMEPTEIVELAVGGGDVLQ